jgi:hypothetical protein
LPAPPTTISYRVTWPSTAPSPPTSDPSVYLDGERVGSLLSTLIVYVPVERPLTEGASDARLEIEVLTTCGLTRVPVAITRITSDSVCDHQAEIQLASELRRVSVHVDATGPAAGTKVRVGRKRIESLDLNNSGILSESVLIGPCEDGTVVTASRGQEASRQEPLPADANMVVVDPTAQRCYARAQVTYAAPDVEPESEEARVEAFDRAFLHAMNPVDIVLRPPPPSLTVESWQKVSTRSFVVERPCTRSRK